LVKGIPSERYLFKVNWLVATVVRLFQQLNSIYNLPLESVMFRYIVMLGGNESQGLKYVKVVGLNCGKHCCLGR
jgi:hypothetical protein